VLVILSGVSGAGKDTIKKELIKRMPNIVTLLLPSLILLLISSLEVP